MVALNALAVPEQAGPNLTQKLNESTLTCELLLFSYEIYAFLYIFFANHVGTLTPLLAQYANPTL